jgi:adenylyltransferase/sulfurtransferase
VLPGILGSLQANEVIKVISGVGEPLVGKLFLFDAASFETRTLKVAKDPSNPISGDNPSLDSLIDYDQFCGIGDQFTKAESAVPEITVSELSSRLGNGSAPVVIDVREPYEYDIVNIEGLLIPQGSVEDHLDQIPSSGDVIVHCRSGKRSADVIRLLQRKYGYNNLYNLKGGILAWAREIDEALPVY